MKRILFVGNSFTYFNDLPGVFSLLANAAGFPVEAASVVKGGWYLSRYADPQDVMGAVLREEYPKQEWDYIVLQDQSLNPASNPQDFLSGAQKLVELMSCKERFVFYQTWAYETGSEKLAGTGMSYETMRDGLRASYRQAAEACGGLLVPVGDAFSLCRDELPQLQLYKPDNFHPSVQGTYLAACLFLTCLSGLAAPEQPLPEGLGDEEARLLRQAAARTLAR